MCDATGLQRRRACNLAGLYCRPASIMLIVHLLMHIYQNVSLSWRFTADLWLSVHLAATAPERT